jgi:hypothetical protein
MRMPTLPHDKHTHTSLWKRCLHDSCTVGSPPPPWLSRPVPRCVCASCRAAQHTPTSGTQTAGDNSRV